MENLKDLKDVIAEDCKQWERLNNEGKLLFCRGDYKMHQFI